MLNTFAAAARAASTFAQQPEVAADLDVHALVATLYRSVSDTPPWQAFAQVLRAALRADYVSITLHHAGEYGRDIYVMAAPEGDCVDWAEVEAQYRQGYMAHDPQRLDLMAPGQLSYAKAPDLSWSTQLRATDSLRMCVAEPGGAKCWLDIVRAAPVWPEFAAHATALLQLLRPHLETALGLFAQLQRQQMERFVYAGMLDHFGLGCMLLNSTGEVMHTNPIAQQQLARGVGLAVREGCVSLGERSAQRQLETTIAAIAAARAQGPVGQEHDTLLRLGSIDAHMLGILVQPVPQQPLWLSPNAHTPCVVLYISELHASPNVFNPLQAQSVQRVSSLFDLTRQEATLALLLAYGLSIVEAATRMGIGESAVRNYSKKIYAKMGISSQTDLVRMMQRSVSLLR